MQQELVIQAIVKLGEAFTDIGAAKPWQGYHIGVSQEEYEGLDTIVKSHKAYNGWFTEDSIRLVFSSWGDLLKEDMLINWVKDYPFNSSKKVAVIAAGNIPMVGFHDVLSVLLSGHYLMLKCSSDDNRMIPYVLNLLIKLNPELENKFEIVQNKLEGFDAVIATGSNNTSKYFESYFSKYPHVIRKNRTSVAVISDDVKDEELKLLGKDIFQYFGLGCRNVSKIYIPKGFDLDRFFQAIYDYNEIINHNKYANNYDYQKAIHLMNRDEILDNGFLLLKEDDKLHSPLGMLYYERYENLEELNVKLADLEGELQCIVGKDQAVSYGDAQSPGLTDYADNVDTLDFLSKL